MSDWCGRRYVEVTGSGREGLDEDGAGWFCSSGGAAADDGCGVRSVLGHALRPWWILSPTQLLVLRHALGRRLPAASAGRRRTLRWRAAECREARAAQGLV